MANRGVRRRQPQGRRDGLSAAATTLRVRRGLKGLVALFDRLVDRFEQRSVLRRSIKRDDNCSVGGSTEKRFDLACDTAGGDHDVETAADEDRGQLIEGFD